MAKARDEARFESTVRLVQARLVGRMEAHEALLRGTAGLFMASEHVTLEEFHAYVKRLELEQYDPGVQELGFSQRIPPALIYMEPPRALSQAVPGQDLSTVPTLRLAMERAWDTGRPSLSGKILLPAGDDVPGAPGFVLFVPVYRSAMNIAAGPTGPEPQEGFVHGTFRADELFTRLFSNMPTNLVSFRVYDGTEALPEHLLHDSAPVEERARDAVFTHSVRVDVVGHPWTLVFSSRPIFEWSLLRPWVPGVGAIGLLFSMLLFTFVRAQQSARSEAEAQRTQLRTITDRLPALIAYIDEQEHYRFVNRAYETWFGIRPRDIHGRSVQDFAGEKGYGPEVRNRIQQALAGEEVHHETELPIPGGRTRYVTLHYIPDRDEQGHVRGLVALVQDITERKQTEEAIQQAVRLRDEFLSVASHELKTPLTSLSLRLQLLAREAQSQPASPFVARVGTQVEAGRKQVQRLADLVGDLLDVARISSGKMQLHWEPVDFAAVVREVVARMEPQATKAEAPLTVEVPEALEGTSDRMRLEQVAENLLTNAIKYGAGQPILVRMEATSERVTLTVRDRGIGIAPEHQARIFERFERAVSDRNYGGLGLGLYITRTLVQAMGGDIGVQSAPGQGATFTVNLPRAPEPPAS
jgi:PAS domain S-box-containing protein